MKVTFEIGDRVEMTHVKSASGQKLAERKYGSQVLDFDGYRTAKLSMPILEGKVIPLEEGDDYEISFFTNAGLYRCKARIRKRYVENNMYVMEVLFLTDLQKYQRRKFYRLDCMFSIQYRTVSEVELLLRDSLKRDKWSSATERERCVLALEELPKEWSEGTVSDLSGGGIRFHCNKEIPVGAMIEVKFPLPLQNGIIPMTFLLKVMASVNYQGSRIAHEIRGEFVDVKDAEREMVVKYVFEEQRRRMRKE